jgi:hypothetical protein
VPSCPGRAVSIRHSPRSAEGRSGARASVEAKCKFIDECETPGTCAVRRGGSSGPLPDEPPRSALLIRAARPQAASRWLRPR